ncbi:MAG TPA: T9SS type A sorting domain-containing protein [Ignavibacteria bacterium]|nr:T9SS type A sorting domain-containing protein [Ignavibacteria bacterium]
MKNLFKILSLIFCFAVITSSIKANQVGTVVPNTYGNLPGTATFLGPLANAPRTYQLLINSNQLTGIVGQYITAIAWRIPVSSTSAWPASETIFSSYDIYLSGSVPPSDRSLTFALNIVGTQTQVRSGGLTVAPDAYPFNEIPNRFGPEIMFNTPYHYTGGHLLVEIRHTGFTGTSRSTDAIGTAIPGYGTDFSACWTGNYTGTAGSQGNFSVVQLTSLVTGIHTEPGIPAEYSLKQNYPNPFNPATTINFAVPTNQFVTLKVFDKLGREIATLVNEMKTAGNHYVNFFADDLASGIYFYKIQAGDFTETKKMMLIK